MTDPSNLGFSPVVINDGGSNAQPCGQINLTTGSYDIKIEGFHSTGDVKEKTSYRCSKNSKHG